MGLFFKADIIDKVITPSTVRVNSAVTTRFGLNCGSNFNIDGSFIVLLLFVSFSEINISYYKHELNVTTISL